MSQPRYQVFVSSTFRDLEQERQAVLNAILKLNQFPAGMEIFPAVNDTAWKHIEKVIKDSDYYVLIIGGKYGSIDSESGLSYTEKEYDFAVSQNIPVLAFTHSDQESIPIGKSELNSDTREKLQNFKQKVGNRHHWNYWKTLEELKSNVISSLSMAFVMNPQHGWVKASGVDKSELLERLAELQKKYDRLHSENNKLKASSSMVNSSILAQGDDEIVIPLTHNFSHFKVTISWNDLFLEIGDILISHAKIKNYYLNEFLVPKLALYLDDSERSAFSHRSEINHEILKDIGNQFVALDLIKVGFDRQDHIYWSITDKGRKLFALQTAYKRNNLLDVE